MSEAVEPVEGERNRATEEIVREKLALFARRQAEYHRTTASMLKSEELKRDNEELADAFDHAADLLDRLEGEREPVAWMATVPDGRTALATERSLVAHGDDLTPLYRLRTDQGEGG